MTRDQYRTAALNLLESVGAGVDDAENVESLLALLIDATRAVAYATLAGPDRADLVTADGWCACPRKPYQHRLSPRCGARPMPPPDMERYEDCYCGDPTQPEPHKAKPSHPQFVPKGGTPRFPSPGATPHRGITSDGPGQ